MSLAMIIEAEDRRTLRSPVSNLSVTAGLKHLFSAYGALTAPFKTHEKGPGQQNGIL